MASVGALNTAAAQQNNAFAAAGSAFFGPASEADATLAGRLVLRLSLCLCRGDLLAAVVAAAVNATKITALAPAAPNARKAHENNPAATSAGVRDDAISAAVIARDGESAHCDQAWSMWGSVLWYLDLVVSLFPAVLLTPVPPTITYAANATHTSQSNASTRDGAGASAGSMLFVEWLLVLVSSINAHARSTTAAASSAAAASMVETRLLYIISLGNANVTPVKPSNNAAAKEKLKLGSGFTPLSSQGSGVTSIPCGLSYWERARVMSRLMSSNGGGMLKSKCLRAAAYNMSSNKATNFNSNDYDATAPNGPNIDNGSDDDVGGNARVITVNGLRLVSNNVPVTVTLTTTTNTCCTLARVKHEHEQGQGQGQEQERKTAATAVATTLFSVSVQSQAAMRSLWAAHSTLLLSASGLNSSSAQDGLTPASQDSLTSSWLLTRSSVVTVESIIAAATGTKPTSSVSSDTAGSDSGSEMVGSFGDRLVQFDQDSEGTHTVRNSSSSSSRGPATTSIKGTSAAAEVKPRSIVLSVTMAALAYLDHASKALTTIAAKCQNSHENSTDNDTQASSSASASAAAPKTKSASKAKAAKPNTKTPGDGHSSDAGARPTSDSPLTRLDLNCAALTDAVMWVLAVVQRVPGLISIAYTHLSHLNRHDVGDYDDLSTWGRLSAALLSVLTPDQLAVAAAAAAATTAATAAAAVATVIGNNNNNTSPITSSSSTSAAIGIQSGHLSSSSLAVSVNGGLKWPLDFDLSTPLDEDAKAHLRALAKRATESAYNDIRSAQHSVITAGDDTMTATETLAASESKAETAEADVEAETEAEAALLQPRIAALAALTAVVRHLSQQLTNNNSLSSSSSSSSGSSINSASANAAPLFSLLLRALPTVTYILRSAGAAPLLTPPGVLTLAATAGVLTPQTPQPPSKHHGVDLSTVRNALLLATAAALVTMTTHTTTSGLISGGLGSVPAPQWVGGLTFPVPHLPLWLTSSLTTAPAAPQQGGSLSTPLVNDVSQAFAFVAHHDSPSVRRALCLYLTILPTATAASTAAAAAAAPLSQSPPNVQQLQSLQPPLPPPSPSPLPLPLLPALMLLSPDPALAPAAAAALSAALTRVKVTVSRALAAAAQSIAHNANASLASGNANSTASTAAAAAAVAAAAAASPEAVLPLLLLGLARHPDFVDTAVPLTSSVSTRTAAQEGLRVRVRSVRVPGSEAADVYAYFAHMVRFALTSYLSTTQTPPVTAMLGSPNVSTSASVSVSTPYRVKRWLEETAKAEDSVLLGRISTATHILSQSTNAVGLSTPLELLSLHKECPRLGSVARLASVALLELESLQRNADSGASPSPGSGSESAVVRLPKVLVAAAAPAARSVIESATATAAAAAGTEAVAADAEAEAADASKGVIVGKYGLTSVYLNTLSALRVAPSELIVDKYLELEHRYLEGGDDSLSGYVDQKEQELEQERELAGPGLSKTQSPQRPFQASTVLTPTRTQRGVSSSSQPLSLPQSQSRVLSRPQPQSLLLSPGLTVVSSKGAGRKRYLDAPSASKGATAAGSKRTTAKTSRAHSGSHKSKNALSDSDTDADTDTDGDNAAASESDSESKHNADGDDGDGDDNAGASDRDYDDNKITNKSNTRTRTRTTASTTSTSRSHRVSSGSSSSIVSSPTRNANARTAKLMTKSLAGAFTSAPAAAAKAVAEASDLNSLSSRMSNTCSHADAGTACADAAIFDSFAAVDSSSSSNTSVRSRRRSSTANSKASEQQ